MRPKTIDHKLKTKKGAALITGAAKRIGREIALYLASEGYDIALHYHLSKKEAVSTAAAIYQLNRRCELFCADLSDSQQVLALIKDVQGSMKNLSVLVNSASLVISNQFGALDLSVFASQWDVNFKAPYILSCEYARLIKKGQIINLIDTNSVKYQSLHEDYLLTKKALGEFTKMAAVSWGPAIRVNGISPGMILPPVNNQQDTRLARAKRIPLQKVGHPGNITQTVGFILKNNYLTGQIISVDGGEALV